MKRLLAIILSVWTVLFTVMATQQATQSAPPPSRDATLDQLRSIQLPHIFSPAERSIINNQLDILRLGVDLFMAQERQLFPEDQQLAFNNAWPILRCIFAKDFETACPGSNSQGAMPTANAQPPRPQEPDSMANSQ